MTLLDRHPSRPLVALALLLGATAPAQERLDALIDGAGEQEVTVEVLADALLAEGPDAAGAWALALDLRRPGRTPLFPEEAPPALDGATLTQLESLAALVPAELEERLADLDDARALVAAQVGLDLIGVHGDADDLPRCLHLATPRPTHEVAPYREVGGRLAEAVTALLLRDSRAYTRVARSYGMGHEWLDLYLVRSLGGARTSRALQQLPSLLGVVHRLDAAVLVEVGNVARTVEQPLSDGGGLRVRRYLEAIDAEQRKQAAVAVGRLDDYEAVEGLIELLADRERGVRTNAYWALREITAMTIDADPARWRLWFDDETGWWAQEAHGLLAYLDHPDSAEVCRAINECATKRLFRRELTAPLLPMLRHPDPTVVRAACSALFALRAADAAPAMVGVLERPETEVRAHAHAMLAGLTGRELPAEPEAWRAALAGPPLPAAR